MYNVKTGLEQFIKSPPEWIKNSSLGLVCNPASTDRQFNHARELINQRFPGQLKALYSPQHGFFAEKQDNMIESSDMFDPVLNIPVFSLYGKTRKPDNKMLDLVDILIIDLQDAGTRVYTFIYTMSYCLEAAKELNKKVIILDRPNPVNGIRVEGNCLCRSLKSFVGRYPIPMRHGLTIGELARLFNDYYEIGCNLHVVPMSCWKRSMYFYDTGLPWIPPSPNLPVPVSSMVYPGQVIWEGTNISEARGTTQPFEVFGAPFIDTREIIEYLETNTKNKQEITPGIILRPVIFEPTSNKWSGQSCRGFQIHIIDPDKYQPYLTSLRLLQAVINLYKEEFKWKNPPYEYEYEKLPIDLIIGNKKIRQALEAGENINNIEASWQDELDKYRKMIHKFYLYN
ncbi:DUF1343 [Desulfonema limicola]|uniref:DUF1343 n=1 Tax=Desulfonema limicola TaxID=45656 RepID=A0A975B7L2_9BACT|nr:DUF1343 domain-containing protein [Desulfonema limicola]QTA80347.1 DUF1343 [Desulfonema limicola]